MKFPQATSWIVPALLSCALLTAVLTTIRWIGDGRQLPVAMPVYPDRDDVGVATGSRVTIKFNKSMLPESINTASFVLRDNDNRIVPASVSYQRSTHAAILTPLAALLPGGNYRVAVHGGKDGVRDRRGNLLATDQEWRFTTGVELASSPAAGPGGPILLVTNSENGFSQYYAEILRNEGLNEFATTDSSQLNAATLRNYEVVLLGEAPLDERQALVLADWVHEGGNLIAMRPDAQLARGFRLTRDDSGPGKLPLHDGYLAIDTSTSAGAGLVGEPIQFHGPADKYILREGAPLATLYENATTATPFPAVWMQKVGQGNVAFFSYDLARSVVYTRQGNPLWSGLERDGITPIRPDDLFYGESPSDPKPDWVDMNKIAIPQADEQQRLLAKIITLINFEKEPLPHFWYLPRGAKAVIVMTGDDHGTGGTVKRFRSYAERSDAGCSVERWQCIRATSNIFVGSVSASQADSFVAQGFEIALHVSTKCSDWPTELTRQPDGTVRSQVDRAAVDSLYGQQLAAFAAKYPRVPAPRTVRTHCLSWGDYDTQPQVEFDHGIRYDTNYYFWPPQWVKNQPGFFTGSGLPMRFAKRDGSIIDVYQATTQMTDESQQVYPYTVDSLLSEALGDSAYYGVFTVNMHNDRSASPGSDAIIAAAISRHVPVVTAAQMLRWLDGRNSSSFQHLTWSAGQLGFTISVAEGAGGIEALLPINSKAGTLVSLTLNGGEAKRQLRKIAGLDYAAFSAAPGKFLATYRPIRD